MHDLPVITTIAAAFTAAWLLGLLTQRLGGATSPRRRLVGAALACSDARAADAGGAVRRRSGARVRTMPESWSNKDERQYEHIKESASKEGRSAKTAKRIAAATVNKQRSSEGHTKSGGSKKSASSKGGASKRSGGAKKSSARTKAGGSKSGGSKSSSKKSSSKKSSSSSTRSKKVAAGRKGGKATARKRGGSKSSR